jgi:molybdopterin synthase catalytic subunit
MRIHIRTFAVLRELATDRCDLDLDEGADVGGAWSVLEARFPGLAPHRPFVRAARNGAYAAWDARLGDGDEIAFLPPVSGGGTWGLTNVPIDLVALERSVATAGHGAIVTFVGRARDVADDGRAVTELEYEAFEEMAAGTLAAIVREVEERYDAAVAVVHRTGSVPLGEVAVAIVAAAPHRGDAYDANRYVIEQIKERLPIWKRERFADGSEWKRPGA